MSEGEAKIDASGDGRNPVVPTQPTRFFCGQRNMVVDKQRGGRVTNRAIRVGNLMYDGATAIPAGTVLFKHQENTLRDESDVEGKSSKVVMGSMVLRLPATSGPPRDTT